MRKQIIGVDYSLNSPAIATRFTDSEEVSFYARCKKPLNGIRQGLFSFYSDLPHPDGMDNMEKYISNAYLTIAAIDSSLPTKDVHIFFEGYAFGATTNVLTTLAENAAVLKYLLYLNHYRNVTILSPQTIKKSATGNGRAKKDEMYASFSPKTGLDLSFISKSRKTSPVSDIVDAYFIMEAGFMKIA